MDASDFILQEGRVEGTARSARGIERIAAELLEKKLVLVNLDFAEEEVADSVRVAIADPVGVCDDGLRIGGGDLGRQPARQVNYEGRIHEDLACGLELKLARPTEVGAIQRRDTAEFMELRGDWGIAVIIRRDGREVVIEEIDVFVSSGQKFVSGSFICNAAARGHSLSFLLLLSLDIQKKHGIRRALRIDGEGHYSMHLFIIAASFIVAAQVCFRRSSGDSQSEEHGWGVQNPDY